MGKKLYVGSLSFQTTEEGLKGEFSKIGAVESVKLITDHHSGKSKGFAFVEMVDDKGAEEAIKQLHGKNLDGREIVVNEARPQEPRSNNREGRGGGGRRDGGGPKNRW